MPAAEQMQMQMIYRLAAILARVDHDPIAFSSFSLRAISAAAAIRCPISAAYSPLGFCGGGDVLLGNDEQVGWGLGIDIGKADANSSS